MEITNARELNKVTKEDIVEMFCEDLMNTIRQRNAKGGRETCFDNASAVRVKNGEGDYTYYPAYKFYALGESRFKMEYIYVPFENYKDAVRAKFRSAGYTVKPTGYLGGVWQTTEDIVW